MRFPKGGRGLKYWIARSLFQIYERPLIQYFFAPLLVTAPPVAVIKYFDNKTATTWLSSAAPQLAEWLQTYSILVIVGVAVYSALLLALAKFVVKTIDARGVNVEGLLTLLAVIDNIVGCKEKRFGNHTRDIPHLDSKTAFCAITQPQIQIAEIVRGICEFFNATRTSKNRNLIKVILPAIENGQVSEIAVNYPDDEHVRTPIEVLNRPNSAILTAVKTKKIVVIDSIEKEVKRPHDKRRFAVGNRDDSSGSLICYPVIHDKTNDVPFVISIHCDQEHYFREEFSELYETALQRFALRLSLEYSLLLIKEKLCEPAN